VLLQVPAVSKEDEVVLDDDDRPQDTFPAISIWSLPSRLHWKRGRQLVLPVTQIAVTSPSQRLTARPYSPPLC
jgi:hypothetical protein